MLISDLDHLHEAPTTARAAAVGDRSRIVLVTLLLIMTIVYAPVFLTAYATPDDYVTGSVVSQGGTSELKIRLAGGRPLDAVFQQITFSLVTNIDNLRYLRALGVLGIVLLAWYFSRVLVATGWGFFESLFLSVIVFTTPAFQVYASWAVAAFYPFAALTAGIALQKIDRLFSTRLPENRWRTVAGLLGATALMVASLSVYQPAAMLFWAFAAVTLFRPGLTFRPVFLRFVWQTGVCAAALAGGYVIYRFGQTLFGTGLLHPLRSQLVADVPKKMVWFVEEPLVNALNWVLLFPRIWVAIPVAIIVILGLLLYFEGTDVERLGQLAIALMILPLSYLPNLIVAENWSSYRTLSALSAVIVVYMFFALAGYVKLRRRFGAVPPAAGLLAAPALLACIIASYNVQTYFASPLYRERMWIHEQLRSADLTLTPGIYVLPSEWYHSIAPDVRYDEFGFPFSARNYSLKAAVSQSVNELRFSKVGIPIEIAASEGPRQPPPGFLLLDMRKIWSLKFDS
jgi:hypothetical protein